MSPVVVLGMEDSRAYGPALATAGAAGYWRKDGDLGALTELLGAAAATAPAATPPTVAAL